MRALVTLCLGVFSVMALSNAIVPVLPDYAPGTAIQGAIYSAYFLGAFLLTLPAGILSDRWGQKPLIRMGLLFTIISGGMLLFLSSPVLVIIARLIEGTGAGLFVASAMSYANSGALHQQMSGYFMAMLNTGLVTGLILSGWLVGVSGFAAAGVLFFMLLCLIPFCISIISPIDGEPGAASEIPAGRIFGNLLKSFKNYFWLWVSSVVLIGITGAVTALYPQFSGETPGIVGTQIAAMNGATAIAVILVAHVRFNPINTIRLAAIFTAGAVMACFITPWAFILIGALAGIVMIAQLTFLAEAGREQGTFMGMFNTSSYLGMTLLPLIAGIVAGIYGFMVAFLITAIFALIVAATIGFCHTCGNNPGYFNP
jgi:MFS family permease